MKKEEMMCIEAIKLKCKRVKYKCLLPLDFPILFRHISNFALCSPIGVVMRLFELSQSNDNSIFMFRMLNK